MSDELLLGPGRKLTDQEHEAVLDALHIVTGVVLFEFAREQRGARDVILRNLVARVDRLAAAVFALWALEDHQDCWVLHRCLLDRYFHMANLQATDSFEAFEAWSFLEQVKAEGRVLGDSTVDTTRGDLFVPLTPEQKARAKSLFRDPPTWRRPKAEDVAKELGMRFLYTYGYSHASAWVHPMADDGDQDFHRITGLGPAPPMPDQSTVLVDSLILQDAMNASTMSWMALVFNVITDIREFMASADTSFIARLSQLSEAFRQGLPLSHSASSKGAV